jgi:tRNA nucleotidyltransferase/poly(A) polymerase
MTPLSSVDPMLARAFAVEVVRRLRASGHAALWAGGCVRDQLMGQLPKDYDVATDAAPERVRQVFGKRRTLPIGASFGVITVLGPKGAGQIDVATFRRDGAYSDGRHPDAVAFSDARDDARRRDFTINGLFFDPLTEQVIDFVGGQEDLARGVIRAIGDAGQRISEDKLRMLRAVRFAARFDFAIESRTLAAIQEQAHELVIVSAERVAAELRLILTHASRARGVELLSETGLLEIVLPESRAITLDPQAWSQMLAILASLHAPTFAMALAALVRGVQQAESGDIALAVSERWKLANDELEGVQKLLREEPLIRAARRQPWPKLQRVLAAPRAAELLGYCEAVARVSDGTLDEIEFCRQKLALPPAELNPPPLVTGADLKLLGIPPGPVYRQLLEAVRDAQLEGRISTVEEAVKLVEHLWQRGA